MKDAQALLREVKRDGDEELMEGARERIATAKEAIAHAKEEIDMYRKGIMTIPTAAAGRDFKTPFKVFIIKLRTAPSGLWSALQSYSVLSHLSPKILCIFTLCFVSNQLYVHV